MKILLSSHSFAPSVGGIETVSQILAEQLSRCGHEVTVVTKTSTTRGDAYPFPVLRNPGLISLIKLLRSSDLLFQNNISLWFALPLLVVRKPWIITHQTWIQRVNGSSGFRDYLKKWLLSFAHSVSISKGVAENLGTPSILIPNPYQDNLFRILPEVRRSNDLIFVGRLVSDKGVDLLLQAIARLQQEKLFPGLTIVGSGPESAALQSMAETLNVAPQVHWAGTVIGEDLVRLLNQHRILVVPSRWNEPFGVVALEAIACGCVVLGSDGGGLKEAIGTQGDTFPNGDVSALSEKLAHLLTDTAAQEHCRSGAAAHLRKHSPKQITEAYLRLFETAMHPSANSANAITEAGV